MKVRNIGATGRSIAVPGHPPVYVDAGEVAEVDDDIGKALLDQPDRWRPPDDYVCEVCGFEAKNAVGLASHQRTHNEEEG